MKILFCTRNDLKGNLALNHFLREVDLKKYEVKVILSRHISKNETIIEELINYEFLECYLMDTIFELVERNNPGGKREQKNYSFDQLSARYGVEIRQMGKPAESDYLDFLDSYKPDLMLSCRYDYIFKENVINRPTIGILNVHPGALPEYRGLMAPFYALKNGEEQLGVTVHWIDNGIDTGNVIAIDYLEGDKEKAVFDYYIELYLLGVSRLLTLLDPIHRGEEIEGRVQDGGGYNSSPGVEDFINFRREGFKMFDYANYIDIIKKYYQ